jgi:hypothetical protein
MSLASTIASALYAALPRQLRCPSPRKSEGMREFEALLARLSRDQASSGPRFDSALPGVTLTPSEGPVRALARRARN